MSGPPGPHRRGGRGVPLPLAVQQCCSRQWQCRHCRDDANGSLSFSYMIATATILLLYVIVYFIAAPWVFMKNGRDGVSQNWLQLGACPVDWESATIGLQMAESVIRQ
jgi:hypothetical protein